MTKSLQKTVGIEIDMEMVHTRFLASGWLLLCLVFGGSSTGGILVNGLLQIAAGAILVYLALSGAKLPADRSARLLLLLFLIAAALALLTLLPLPPGMWQRLAGRGSIAEAYSLVGMPLPWLPLSLTPDATIATLFALLPPLAMFLLILRSSEQGRRNAIFTITAFAFASVLFGVVQQISGFNSNTYIYQYTSRGGAVGFFSNRNHLATLCLMTMPLLAALVALARHPQSGRQPGKWILAVGMLALLVIGALVVQSLAGWLLLPPTLIACSLLLRRPGKRRPSRTLIAVIAALLSFAILVALFAPWSTTDLFPVSGEVRPQERRAIMGLTWQAATTFFPFGSGFGSFVSIYPRFEDPAVAVGAYVNHAHNDYLELLLETGIAGVLLVAAYLLWWGDRIRNVWRQGGNPIARAATIGIGVALAHSFVDYPVRTAAIACVLALCCGLAVASVPVRFAEPGRTPRPAPPSRTIMLGRAEGRETARAPRRSNVT